MDTLPLIATLSALLFALTAYTLRRLSTLGPAILLGGLAAICVGLWWGTDSPAHEFLFHWVLLPGLPGAVVGVGLAWWRV
ncbi:hypothetical protein [Vannielia litorea]|uniref:hypothetical protein n=1 Tax=Vannielia litorea TaxID=1217970 RepID=UPI001C93B8F7|nr:hypothetical protein [Vannielia litorea]MBY6046817.1 hypothetical protein [Vannielia litorea]MBY6074231.1 hypothetical protein [Vannielia litorea]